MWWSCRTSCFAPTVMGKATYAFQISVSSPQTRWFVLKLKPIKNILWSEVKFRALDLFFVHITCQGIVGGCAEHHTISTQLRKKHWKQYICFILLYLFLTRFVQKIALTANSLGWFLPFSGVLRKLCSHLQLHNPGTASLKGFGNGSKLLAKMDGSYSLPQMANFAPWYSMFEPEQ
jgi:hypothetical protein